MWDSSVTWSLFFGLSAEGIPCYNKNTPTKLTTCTFKGGYEGKLGKIEVDSAKKEFKDNTEWEPKFEVTDDSKEITDEAKKKISFKADEIL